jgi:hypothetical protein
MAFSPAPAIPDDDFALLDAWWRAANYLSAGQIYLMDNPLLREKLVLSHIKPRLLGHWGTTPGLNFIYAHMNRAINARDLDAIFIAGPGHGGPGVVANTYLEGTYSEVYPAIGQDAEGLQRLFTQFSFPGGIPSHVAPETPGSIHEGGELGYSLLHAYGAVFDNPSLLACCVIGDGEAETGALAASWHSNKFLNPQRFFAALPRKWARTWPSCARACRSRAHNRKYRTRPACSAVSTKPWNARAWTPNSCSASASTPGSLSSMAPPRKPIQPGTLPSCSATGPRWPTTGASCSRPCCWTPLPEPPGAQRAHLIQRNAAGPSYSYSELHGRKRL